jgi:hypothetical protein
VLNNSHDDDVNIYEMAFSRLPKGGNFWGKVGTMFIAKSQILIRGVNSFILT